MRVAITGLGIISAIGNHAEEHFFSLKNKQSGVGKLALLETAHDNLPFGEIKLTNQQLEEALDLPKKNNFTRASLLGLFAVKQAIKQANLNLIGELSFINGTSVGGMDFSEKYWKEFKENSPKNKYIEAQHPGFTTNTMAEAMGLKNYTTTISTACSSGANAIIKASKLIENNQAHIVLAGATDCLSKFTINGFNSLKILSEKPCMPFDKNRTGLNLGEGAAYLILESEQSALKRNQPILAYLSGYGNANDAFHQTASSETGEGSFLTMQKALEKSGLETRDIDYINAHGTATYNNDLSEGIAISKIFESEIPEVSSTKAFTGHTLAAAGAIEAVFSTLAIQQQCIFPNLNFQDKIEEIGFEPQTGFVEKEINHVLSNSFGFGGNCSSLIFSKA
ncbi:beta-ketoacyl synthase [Mesonia sp. K7]|uniref:beta-ketoacyl-[acyl-carrier-protein] synthase family protein n=1 Tax=Mesonia sp. K7 TaxID=2218606 RepID=UPI0026BBBE52